MEGFCCTLLSMSLAAALTALGVMVARLFLYKLPRALICGLWLVVLFRMACPVSVSLPVGLVPHPPYPVPAYGLWRPLAPVPACESAPAEKIPP